MAMARSELADIHAPSVHIQLRLVANMEGSCLVTTGKDFLYTVAHEKNLHVQCLEIRCSVDWTRVVVLIECASKRLLIVVRRAA